MRFTHVFHDTYKIYIGKITFTFVQKVKYLFVNGNRIPVGEYNKQKIFEYIVANATPLKGVYQHEIRSNVEINPKPTRQTIHNHARELIEEEKIYKQDNQYFPVDWDLNSATYFANFLRNQCMRFIDPYLVSLEAKDIQEEDQYSAYDEFIDGTIGISVSEKYCKTSFNAKNDLNEKYLFEYANRIGAFITYVFIESMRPRRPDRNISDERREEMSKGIIFNSLKILRLLDFFYLFLKEMGMFPDKEIPWSKESKDVGILELDKSSFDKLLGTFRNVYPKIYEGIEKFWFGANLYLGETGKLFARTKQCQHKWQDHYIYKMNKKFYLCVKCKAIAESPVLSEKTVATSNKKKGNTKRKKL